MQFRWVFILRGPCYLLSNVKFFQLIWVDKRISRRDKARGERLDLKLHAWPQHAAVIIDFEGRSSILFWTESAVAASISSRKGVEEMHSPVLANHPFLFRWSWVLSWFTISMESSSMWEPSMFKIKTGTTRPYLAFFLYHASRFSTSSKWLMPGHFADCLAYQLPLWVSVFSADGLFQLPLLIIYRAIAFTW